jgi:hypothetical protein
MRERGPRINGHVSGAAQANRFDHSCAAARMLSVAAELDALIPSILSCAFRGEL